MGCIYNVHFSDFTGKCTLELKHLDDGICIYEDDPNPGDSCEWYESDYTCPECGADLNIEDCECN